MNIERSLVEPAHSLMRIERNQMTFVRSAVLVSRSEVPVGSLMISPSLMLKQKSDDQSKSDGSPT